MLKQQARFHRKHKMHLLATTWSPEIGDSTVIGWATVVAYGLVSILCALVGLRSSSPSGRRRWMCLAATTLLLGASKRWDLLSLITALGRDLGSRQGWAEERDAFQLTAMAAVAFMGWLVFRAAACHTACRWSRLALTAVAGLAVFVTSRAISLRCAGLMAHKPWVGFLHHLGHAF